MYRYFENKNAIVLAIIERQLQEGRAQIARAALVERTSPPRSSTYLTQLAGPRPVVVNAALFLEMSAEATRDPQIAAGAAPVGRGASSRPAVVDGARPGARTASGCRPTRRGARVLLLECLHPRPRRHRGPPAGLDPGPMRGSIDDVVDRLLRPERPAPAARGALLLPLRACRSPRRTTRASSTRSTSRPTPTSPRRSTRGCATTSRTCCSSTGSARPRSSTITPRPPGASGASCSTGCATRRRSTTTSPCTRPRMRAQGVARFGDRFTAGAARAAAPRGIRPRRGVDRELPQLRRGADRPALLALRPAAPGCACCRCGAWSGT